MSTNPTRVIVILSLSTIVATILLYVNLLVTFPPDIPGRLVQHYYLSKAFAYVVIVILIQFSTLILLYLATRCARNSNSQIQDSTDSSETNTHNALEDDRHNDRE